MADLGGQNLQGHQPIQLSLSGLIHRAHAALAEEAQDFQLWKFGGKLFRRRRAEAVRSGLRGRIAGRIGCCPGSKPHFHEAFGAQALHRFRPSGLPQC